MKRVLVLKDTNHLVNSIIFSGHSLTSFAKRAGVSADTMYNIIRKHQSPRPKTAKKIADGLGKKVNDIFLLKMLGKHSNKVSSNG